MSNDIPIRIFLADDHPLLRTGLKFSFDQSEHIELIGEASDGYSAVEKIQIDPPDVVLLDVDMPGLTGIGVIHLLRRLYPQMKILMLSNYNDDNYIKAAMEAGADGYVLKCVEINELIKIIRSIWEEKPLLSPYLVNLAMGYNGKAKRFFLQKEVRLTPREQQVLQLISEGKGNKEISNMLCVSNETTKSHVKNIFRKLKVRNRVEAIMEARRRNVAV